jgi:3-oxoacyl-[acyl-carrier-protein] synthase-3
MSKYRHGYIMGVGGYLPTEIVKTRDLLEEVKSERFGVPINFIERRIGIIEKRKAEENCQPSDLAVAAGRVAIEKAGITPTDIDCIIFCGIDGNWKEPATALAVQNELEAWNAGLCFDVSNACNGFMSGMYIADSFITAGRIECALVITGEKNSRVVDRLMKALRTCEDNEYFRNRVGALTVGDAGGAMVLGKSTNGLGFKRFNTVSKGQYTKMCYYNYDDHGDIVGEMIMKPIAPTMKYLETEMRKKTFECYGWNSEDIDCLVSHQIGKQYYEQVAKLYGVPQDRCTKTYDFLGNLASASIPVNLYLNPLKNNCNYLFIGGGASITVYQVGVRT